MAFSPRARFFLVLSVFALTARAETFVEFAFELESTSANAFGRDVWAEISAPDHTTRAYPAFFDGGSLWRVRVAARAVGEFKLGGVFEKDAFGLAAPMEARSVGPTRREHAGPLAAAQIRVDPSNPLGFSRDENEPFLPFGLNLGWGKNGFYERALPEFAKGGLNWSRFWMAKWENADLDWLPPESGPSPPPGEIDLGVARRWDEVLALAERHGVYAQLVLQHHGQFSARVNPAWKDHPWNKANGGFLDGPADFFLSPEARQHTRSKFRYIVARYGHSPAIMAWELFNEVNFTDAWRFEGRRYEIARWHDEMAAWIRACDPHRHLITTSSTESIEGPLWRSMDYYQSHLYAVNMLAHARVFPESPTPLDKPIFYGEIGDNHLHYESEGDKASGAGLIPSVWCGLMAERAQPAQAWYWDRLLDTPRWGELTAVARFIAAARMAGRNPRLKAFSPRIESASRAPFRVVPGYHWATRAPIDLRIDNQGRESLELADVPDFFVANPFLIAEGRADRLGLRLDRSRPGTLRFFLTDVGAAGATLSVTIDDREALRREWPAEAARPARTARPAEFVVPVPAGESRVTLRNHGPDSFRLREIDLDADVPALAAIGKRDEAFAMLYLWHRLYVHSAHPGEPARGRIALDEMPAGEWTVTWWDMNEGRVASSETVDHRGGSLVLSTPWIARHAAVFLEKRL